MLVSSVLFAFALSAVGVAQEVDNNDVPGECRAVCASIVSLARQCGDQFDDDREELNCICSANGVDNQLPLCEACVAQFNTDDDDIHDTDMGELLRDCSFTTTTFNPSSTASDDVTNIQGTATRTSPAASPSATDAQTTDASQTSGGATQVTTSARTEGDDEMTTTITNVPGLPTETGGGAEQTDENAAPRATVAAMGIGLGALGFAMGML